MFGRGVLYSAEHLAGSHNTSLSEIVTFVDLETGISLRHSIRRQSCCLQTAEGWWHLRLQTYRLHQLELMPEDAGS